MRSQYPKRRQDVARSIETGAVGLKMMRSLVTWNTPRVRYVSRYQRMPRNRRQRGVIVTGTSCLRSSAPSQTSSSVTGPKVNPAGKSGDGTVISSTSIGPLSPIPKLSRFGSPLSRRPCQKLTDALRAIEDSDAALRRSGGDAWRLATRELMHGRWIGLMSAAGWRIRHVSKGSRVSPIIVCVAWQRVELTANLLTAFSLRC